VPPKRDFKPRSNISNMKFSQVPIIYSLSLSLSIRNIYILINFLRRLPQATTSSLRFRQTGSFSPLATTASVSVHPIREFNLVTQK
jgi:hypothetical protein